MPIPIPINQYWLKELVKPIIRPYRNQNQETFSLGMSWFYLNSMIWKFVNACHEYYINLQPIFPCASKLVPIQILLIPIFQSRFISPQTSPSLCISKTVSPGTFCTLWRILRETQDRRENFSWHISYIIVIVKINVKNLVKNKSFVGQYF